MRLFVAVDIDDKIRNAMADLQSKLKGSGSFEKKEAKWIDPKLVHLTLKFLGEVKNEKAPIICKAVQEVADRHESFSIDVKSVGCFGRPAKVVWVGIEKADSLVNLQQDVEQALADAGWPPEARQFSPHLTICRVKNLIAGKKLGELVKNYTDLQLGSVWIDSVRVYSSELTSTGPIYTVISEMKL